jgi:hypothetical protein
MAEAKIALLLIEPQDTEFGEGLTAPVQATEEKIAKLLIELLAK